ncbi:Glutaredoxin NrdH [hydrothermal vent metagenome]|uniref:Glutaredoxin NrdH n=1 Tax=hydrothermal vent metagenome TaxID=652676 RepID=A0A3B0V991_9ZZZZ
MKYKLLAIFSIILGINATAQIYKWVDSNGVTHYSDAKPAQAGKVEEFAIKSYKTVSFEDSTYIKQDYKPMQRKFTLSKGKVVIYTTQSCGYCKKAKTYFESENIRYTEYDIEKSKTAKKRFDKMGATGVPVILVGKKRMNGFSVAGFEKIYK